MFSCFNFCFIFLRLLSDLNEQETQVYGLIFGVYPNHDAAMFYLEAVKRLPISGAEVSEEMNSTWANIHNRFFPKSRRHSQKWNELRSVLIENGFIEEINRQHHCVRLFN